MFVLMKTAGLLILRYLCNKFIIAILIKYTNSYFVIFLFSALDKNAYNHITATYYLLAERKLRSLEPKNKFAGYKFVLCFKK